MAFQNSTLTVFHSHLHSKSLPFSLLSDDDCDTGAAACASALETQIKDIQNQRPRPITEPQHWKVDPIILAYMKFRAYQNHSTRCDNVSHHHWISTTSKGVKWINTTTGPSFIS